MYEANKKHRKNNYLYQNIRGFFYFLILRYQELRSIFLLNQNFQRTNSKLEKNKTFISFSIARYAGISPSLFTNDMTIACLEFAIFIHKCHQVCHIARRQVGIQHKVSPFLIFNNFRISNTQWWTIKMEK